MTRRNRWGNVRWKYGLALTVGLVALVVGFHMKYNRNVDDRKLDLLRERIVATFEERVKTIKTRVYQDSVPCETDNVCRNVLYGVQGLLDNFNKSPNEIYYIVVNHKLEVYSYHDLYNDRRHHSKYF